MGVNARCVCGGLGPKEGGGILTGWGGVVLSVEDILINWTGEKCSHIEMFTL